MKQRKALEMAREIILMGGTATIDLAGKCVEAIDEALAEHWEPVAWPCEIEEADFSKGIVTIKMNCGDYKVSAGTHFLSKAPRYTHPTPEAPAPSQPLASYGASRDRVGGASVYPTSLTGSCASTVAGENSTERAKVELPYSFYAEKKLKESAPSQQAAQTALAWMRPSIYAECQPETTTLREVADEWIAEGHVVTALGPLSQAEWQELSEEETRELLDLHEGTVLDLLADHSAALRAKNGGVK
jgi:hypothetical protein